MKLPAFLHPFSETGRTGHIRLVAGHDSTVVDDDGNEYLDAIASLWCVNVGHGRAEVIEAVHSQMQALATYNTFGAWTNEPADRLADLIAARAPMADARVFFTNSGSEAVDTAVKLARLSHSLDGDGDRMLVVSREGGYHGTAYGGTSLQGIEPNRVGYGSLLSEVTHVPRHDLEAVATAFAEAGERIGAVIVEPIQGASGVHPPVDGYLDGIRRLCDDNGALLILDEVITGFGRLGEWFGATCFGVEPDLVTFAKAVSSGYVPLGGVIVGGRVREALESDPNHLLRTGFTYSGHPTACAAGIACMEVTESEGLLDRARHIGSRLGAGLSALATDGLAAEVRGEGGIWAVDAPGDFPGGAVAVAQTMLRAGVIARPIADATVACCPPLVVTDPEIDRLVDAYAAALTA
ncbi:MAG: aspartate aminotransferase family protein [Microthrixaceae bacterium]